MSPQNGGRRSSELRSPNGSPSRARQVIEQAAKAKLRQSPYAEVRCVACALRDDILTLEGCVSSYYLKQVAQSAVIGLDGVDQLSNRLAVVDSVYRS